MAIPAPKRTQALATSRLFNYRVRLCQKGETVKDHKEYVTTKRDKDGNIISKSFHYILIREPLPGIWISNYDPETKMYYKERIDR